MYMSSLVQLVLNYCKGDYIKMEKELHKLKCHAISLETDSDSSDSDFEPDEDEEDLVDSEDSEYDDEVEDERITVIRYKSGHCKIA